MNRQSVIDKLKDLADRTEISDPQPVSQDEQGVAGDSDSLLNRIEEVRRKVENLSSSLGVELKPDSLAVPVPVELLIEIVKRIHTLESLSPPVVEFVDPTQE